MPRDKNQNPDSIRDDKKTKAVPVAAKKQKVPAKKKIVSIILPIMPLLEI